MCRFWKFVQIKFIYFHLDKVWKDNNDQSKVVLYATKDDV